MALRGKKPTLVEKRLKAFFYGAAGVGKTMAAIQFPAPYVIDTERGAENSQYISLIEKNNGALFQTTDFSEILTEVKSLLSEKHSYKTLIIDPLTTIYNSLLDSCAEKLRVNGKGGDGTQMGRHYSEANKQLKRLFNLILRLDMNVIITSHAKTEYVDNMKIVGQTFDCYKKMDYLFDLAIEIQKVGKDRVGVIKKTRISSFPEGSSFTFSYEEIANRYGKELMEKKAEAKVIASRSQVSEVKGLVHILRIPSETTEKWFEKANVDCFEDMDSDIIEKCIENLKSQNKKSKAELAESSNIKYISKEVISPMQLKVDILSSLIRVSSKDPEETLRAILSKEGVDCITKIESLEVLDKWISFIENKMSAKEDSQNVN